MPPPMIRVTRASPGASARRGDDHQRALRATPGRTLPGCLSPQDRISRGRVLSTNRTSVLGPIRTVCPRESRALDVDVQALALSPDRRRPGGLSFLRKYFRVFRAPPRGKDKEPRAHVIGADHRRCPLKPGNVLIGQHVFSAKGAGSDQPGAPPEDLDRVMTSAEGATQRSGSR